MDLDRRAARHAALGDPTRLAIVEELLHSDRAPHELAERFSLTSNLLAHHLAVLERSGLIRRTRSAGDGRRRYVTADREAAAALGLGAAAPEGPVLFVCTHNSARSALAAATWERSMGTHAESAGTHPAERFHPGAEAAASRAGLRLAGEGPRHLDQVTTAPALVVTVCDRAHEELDPPAHWWHWSIPDPVAAGSDAAFDTALEDITRRIHQLARRSPWSN